MSLWQHINTAPENTFILIYENGRYHIAKYELTDCDGYFDDPIMLWCFWDGWMDPEVNFNPTHWLPLPEPPATMI